MMICPHCDEPSVSPWAKYCASVTDPFVCDLCDKPSSVPSFVESVSALLHFFALFVGLGVFGFTAMGYMRSGEVTGPPLTSIIVCLLVFYVAVEAAKVCWVPLRALSDSYIDKKKAKANRWMATGVIIVILAILLERCGF